MAFMAQNKPKGSSKARSTAARLAAVQAVYQMLANDQGAKSVIAEYKDRRLGQPVEGDQLVTPDGVLFCAIVEGVEDRRPDLDMILSGSPEKGAPAAHEPLLRSVLLCGAYELMANHDTDAPVIINDYLDVTHAFFDQGESKLVNGTLDRVSKAVRDQA